MLKKRRSSDRLIFKLEFPYLGKTVFILRRALVTVFHEDGFQVNIWRAFRHYEPLARYVKLRAVHAPGMPGTFSPRHRIQRKSLVNDPGMHHGTCVTHVPWCMPGSLTRRAGENVPGIPGACATRIWQEALWTLCVHTIATRVYFCRLNVFLCFVATNSCFCPWSLPSDTLSHMTTAVWLQLDNVWLVHISYSSWVSQASRRFVFPVYSLFQQTYFL